MSVYGSFFSFMTRSFNCCGYNISFWQVIIFGSLCSIAGYLIGSFFKK